jgi:hypothetical protein
MGTKREKGIEMPEITLGMLKVDDAEELRRVAERDSSDAPTGMVLGARVDGRLVAARSVSNGHAVADPFVHTAELQRLLAARAAQLRDGDSGRRGLLSRGYSSSSSRFAA